MSVSISAIIAATVAMFVVGAIWYMPLFGKMWGEMFGFENLSKKEQKVMQSKMAPWMGLQFVVTAFTAFGLAKLMTLLPGYSPYTLAVLLWFGLMVPVTVSSAVFGGTDSKWLPRKLAIQLGESLLHTIVAAWVIGLIQK